MSSGDNEQQPDEAQEEAKDKHATEGGFGTGLRAQLQKRRNEGQAEEAEPEVLK